MFVLLERQAAGRDPQQSPLAVPPGQMPPTTALPQFGNAPAPQLLTNEPDSCASSVRRRTPAARVRLGRQKAGVARVPIEQAKKLLAERGLPARASAADPQLGTHAPAFGEASGGRTIPTGDGRQARRPRRHRPQRRRPRHRRQPKEPAAHAPTGRGGGA